MVLDKKSLLFIAYIVAVMVVVTQRRTFDTTFKVVNLFDKKAVRSTYGYGMMLNQLGYLLHIVVFAILVMLPFILSH